MQSVIQDKFDDQTAVERILKIKSTIGKKLLILTHHYQRKEIVDLGDYKGDSLGLSKKAAGDKKAQYIVFCGVHFMAENTAILAKPHQTVQIPAIEAGCQMADMIDIDAAEKAWKDITDITGADSLIWEYRLIK